MTCRYVLRLYRLATFHVKHGGSLSIQILAQHARWCLAHLDECVTSPPPGGNFSSSRSSPKEMSVARTRSTLVGRAPRRKMIWVRDVGASPAATPTGATDLLTDFRALNGGAQPLGVTVTRMRGRLAAQVSAAPTFLTD